LVLLAWALIAAPQVVFVWGYLTLKDYARGLPATPDLDAWEASAPRTTVISAADGSLLAEIPFRVSDTESGHRFPVAYGDIPEQMIHAVLAAEDQRFFEHAGVDFTAVARAAWANYRAGTIVEGASTITQQVARNLLPEDIGRTRSVRRKVREALLARRIERAYSKQRIFETYVNHAFLGANSYGVVAAARAYFSKTLDELSLEEMAMIAGLAQAPGRADPLLDPAAALERRNRVLERMWRAGFVGEDEFRAAAARPIELRPAPTAYGTLAPWHTARARREIEDAWPDELAVGGLDIETSAAPVLSIESEAAAIDHAATLAKRHRTPPPQIGALVWDHATGYVDATVGGLSWSDSKFDRATQACRQPGSAFKPIVYASALEHGVITPGTPLRDAPIAEWDEDLGVHWKPTNSGRAFRGVALAQDALASSLNAPAVTVLETVGANNVIELAHRLGISSKLVAVRPLALGASCVIPIELAGAFAVFARGGEPAAPIFVVRVMRGSEVLVDRASPWDPTLRPERRLDRLVAAASRPALALDPDTSFQVSSMLSDVVARGTGRDARKVDRPAAGKTGTTNQNTDAWFVGYTGRVVAAVWVGHDDPSVHLGSRAEGSRAALPLWVALVAAAEGDRTPVPVPGEPPPDLVLARIDRETGLLARPGAGGAIDLYFKPGTAPTEHAGGIGDASGDLGRLGREF
jgi:penicillin-binding protein 1A